MDAPLLKAKLLAATKSQNAPLVPNYEFNQSYVGAVFDVEALEAADWREVERDEEFRNVWYERLFRLPGHRLIEFRICLNLLGYWRDANILLFDPNADPGKVRTQAVALPSEIEKTARGVFEAAKIIEYAFDIHQELVDMTYSRIPRESKDDEGRLAVWKRDIESELRGNRTVARRMISGVVRHGHFCHSGEVLAYSTYAAIELGMRPETYRLLRATLDEEAKNTAEYWDLLGCAVDRLGLRGEAFDCFATAHAMAPNNTHFGDNVWSVGRKLMPSLIERRDFTGIVHCAQVMLDCAHGISTAEKADYLCALGLGYEGKDDLTEAATYYGLAIETSKGEPRAESGTPADEEGADEGFCTMAVFGIHRLKDYIPERRLEAFEAQVASFPKTPAEAGWAGMAHVEYIEEKHHGGHWNTVVEDVEGYFEEHLREMVEQGGVEGSAEYPPSEIGFYNYDKSQGLEYPPGAMKMDANLRVFLLLGIEAGKDGATFCSAFPVFGSGGFATMTMDRVYEYPTALEADVRMLSPSRGIHNFFVPDYYRDRGKFRQGYAYKVELAGFAYWMEEFKEQRWQIDKGPMLEREKERLREEGLSDEIASVEVVMDENASLLTPRLENKHDANHEFVGKVVKATSFDFLGNKVHRVVVDFHPDRPGNLRLPIFVGEHKLKGFMPQVGTAVTGILWLQGILREEIGPAAPVEEDDGIIPTNALPDWMLNPNEEGVLSRVTEQALGKLRPEAIEDVPSRLIGEPEMIVRVSGQNFFLFTFTAEVESMAVLEAKLAEVATVGDRFAKDRGVAVEHIGIGLVKQGEGYKILYAGFEKLEEKYGRLS